MPLHWPRLLILIVALAGLLSALPASEATEMKLSNLMVLLNDADVTVQAVLVGAIPPALREGLEGGIPITVRFQVELLQFRRLWVNRLIASNVIERQMTYDLLTKEFRVTPIKDERRDPYTTKELREAQRVVSEFRLKLLPASELNPRDLYFVRVRAEVSTGSGLSFFSRLFPFLGTAGEETPWVESPLLTITRSQ